MQAGRILEAGLLGQARLLQLFDYLVQCASQGRTPKEVEVAVEVFGKSPGVDLAQDASVRVYVHNLRRKLEHYYAGPGRQEPRMLVLPKGEYRLRLLPNPLRTDPPEAPAQQQRPPMPPAAVSTPPPAQSAPAGLQPPPALPGQRRRGGPWVFGAAACLLVLAGAAGWFVRAGHGTAPGAGDSSFWAPVLRDDRPVLLVLGDYYIFGDNGGSMNVTRLIRDFAINSKSDLQQYLLSQPQDMDRYQDVGLSYLPTSSAYALAGLMPVLAQVKPRLRVVTASQLSTTMIKNSDLIYVGWLSGMGALQSAAFSASRFRFGDSFDELIDSRTRQHYLSQASDYVDEQLDKTDPMYRDYGYLSSFAGPTGNRIVIVAGMRDEGLRQTVDFLTDRASLDLLARQVRASADFEGLLEVSVMDHLNLSGKLLLASPMAATAWRLSSLPVLPAPAATP